MSPFCSVEVKRTFFIYFILNYRLSRSSRSSCDRSYRKIIMMSPSVGSTQDSNFSVKLREGHWPAIYLLFFPFPFSFLIVELIQPILPYNKKIITGKREKHAFFFWCLVKVGKNKSIWHGNYSSSPFISHASWGKRWELQKEMRWSLDRDPWKKATLRWDLIRVSVWSPINCIVHTYMFKDIQRPVQDWIINWWPDWI